MTEPSDRRLRINSEDVVWREVGDELVVLHMKTTTYLTINGSGRTLWDRLVDGATLDELVAALVERYGIGTEQAKQDVHGFVESLTACSLLDPPS
jgi:Coenzyme PQQ synthesis protein D (PqqD)